MKKEHKKKITLKRYPKVSVLIPAYNEGESIKGTIESVLSLDYPIDKLEIIVINDGSTDNTSEQIQKTIKKHSGRNIILLNQKNGGKAQALNNALKIATGEFFSCLDADSFVSRYALKRMLKLFYQEGEELAIVTPAMKVKSPKTLLQKFQRVEYITAVFVQRLMGLIDCIYVAPGPFSLYRTKVIRKLGGFEVGNLTEDQEIAYRVQKHHYKIKQCYNAYVHTIAPHNLKTLYKQRNRWFKGSLFNILKYKKLVLNRHYGDFGLFQMPLNITQYVLSITSLFLMIYFLFVPLIQWIYNLFLVGFDIWPYLRESVQFSFSLLSLDIGKLMVFYLLFFITVTIFYIAHRLTNERVREHGMLYLVPYFFVYYIILSFISIIVIVEVALGKKQRW